MGILQEIMIVHQLKPLEMAKRLKVSKSYFSMLLNGERPISKNIALKLNNEFGVPLEVSLCLEVHAVETNTNRIGEDARRMTY